MLRILLLSHLIQVSDFQQFLSHYYLLQSLNDFQCLNSLSYLSCYKMNWIKEIIEANPLSHDDDDTAFHQNHRLTTNDEDEDDNSKKI